MNAVIKARITINKVLFLSMNRDIYVNICSMISIYFGLKIFVFDFLNAAKIVI